jgi:hypothetical protein
MLAWTQQIPMPGVDDVVAYGDDQSPWRFYLLPKAPRFRTDSNGLPVFKFLKYRNPIDRPGSKPGGGFLICDVAFALPTSSLLKSRAALQDMVNQKFPNLNPKPQVDIQSVSFTRGACTLQLLDSGAPNATLVERLQSPAAPSLYGDMITPITVETSPEGATLLENALQDKGGVVQVAYDLYAPVKLPDMVVTVWFNAEKFMEFHQQVSIDWRMYGDDTYRESIRERFVTSDAGGVIIDPGAVTDAKIVNAARDWGFQQLDDAVKRMILGDIPAVSEDARKVPDGIDQLWRSQSVSKVASFRRTYRQGNVIEVNIGPRGTLPNITTILGPDNKPLKWSDFARTVDLDDPFFKKIMVSFRANADFQNLPIDSIDVHLKYDQGNTHAALSKSLRSADQTEKFESFTEAGNRKYRYSYRVNYKGESRSFQAPETLTEDQVITINVGDTGLLQALVQVGDMNFDQVTQALVTVNYHDPANQVGPLEWQFTLDKDRRETKLTKVIFAPRTQPFHYSVKYTMKDGREYLVRDKVSMASQIFIGDPFQADRTISVRALGNLDTDIQTIFVDLKYIDAINNYTQSQSVALSKSTRFFDWTFPVVDDTAGKVVYSGVIQFADGSTKPIPETETTRNTILAGVTSDDQFLTVDIVPDLLDFTTLKLVKVSLRYDDTPNGIDTRKDFLFKNGSSQQQWRTRIIDKLKKDYEYSVTYFLASGATKSDAPKRTSEPTLILQMSQGAHP